MKVSVLKTHHNLYEFLEKGYHTTVRILDADVHTYRDSLIKLNPNGLSIALSDIRGTQIILDLNKDSINKLYELIRKPDYNYPLFPLERITEELKPNKMYLEVDDEGLLVLNPTASEFTYDYTMSRIVGVDLLELGNYLGKSNGDYLVLLNKDELEDPIASMMIFDLMSITEALVTAQCLYGYESLGLRSMSFILPRVYREMDTSLISIGKSRIFYSEEQLYCIQEDLFDKFSMMKVRSGMMELNEIVSDLYMPVSDLNKFSHIEYKVEFPKLIKVVFAPSRFNNSIKVVVPLVSSITTNKFSTVLDITERQIRTVYIYEYSKSVPLLLDKRIVSNSTMDDEVY